MRDKLLEAILVLGILVAEFRREAIFVRLSPRNVNKVCLYESRSCVTLKKLSSNCRNANFVKFGWISSKSIKFREIAVRDRYHNWILLKLESNFFKIKNFVKSQLAIKIAIEIRQNWPQISSKSKNSWNRT